MLSRINKSLKVNNLNGIAYIWVGLILVGVAIRVYLISIHFPHYDDLYGHYRALHIKNLGSSELISKMPKQISIFIELIPDNLLTISKELIAQIAAVYETVNGATFAPFHYFISHAFALNLDNYNSTLVSARITSFFEYIIFFIASIYLIKSNTTSIDRRFGYFLISLSLVSGIYVIYSIQGHNYMASALMMSIMLIFINKKIKVIKPLNLTILYSVAILSSYSFILYLPTFFIFYLIVLYSKPNNLRWKIGRAITSLGVISVPLILSYFLCIRHRNQPESIGVGWQAGFNNEFVVNYTSPISFLGHLIQSVKHTLEALFLPPAFLPIVGYLFSGVIVILILGRLLVKTIVGFKENKVLKNSTLFSYLLLINHTLLYLTGKIAMSPTRHSIIIFLPIVLCAIDGFDSILNRFIVSFNKNNEKIISNKISIANKARQIRVSKLSNMAIYLICTVFFTSGYKTWGDEVVKRIDLLDTQKLNYIKDSRKIMYEKPGNYSLLVAPEIRANFKEENMNSKNNNIKLEFLLLNTKQKRDTNKMFYVSNNFETSSLEDIEEAAESIGCKNPNARTLYSRSSTTIPDPVIVTSIGTNSLHIHEVSCSEILDRDDQVKISNP